MSHLRSVHGQDEDFFIVCGINECSASYKKCSSFASHVYRQHREALTDGTKQIREGEVGSLSSDDPEPIVGVNEQSDTLRHTVDQLLEIDDVRQKEKAALYILNLKDVRGLSESAVQHVVKQTQAIFKHTLGRIQAGVDEHLSRNGIDVEALPPLDDMFDKMDDPFRGLSTTFLQEKFYRENLECIVSVQLHAHAYLITLNII